MTLACWSSKGGSGTTVVAVAFARLLADASPVGALLVDLAGDAAAVSGLPADLGPGVAEWLEVGAGVPADGLARIEHSVLPGLSLVARGAGPLVDLARAEVLAAVLGADPRPVVVDCGTVDDSVGAGVARTLAAGATHSLLVIRPCYLALRRATAAGLRPSGVVVIREPERSLGASDIEDVLGVPVVAVVDYDARVSRAVDSGRFVDRVPVSLRRALRRVA